MFRLFSWLTPAVALGLLFTTSGHTVRAADAAPAAAGQTVTVKVVDASAQPVAGAQVRIVAATDAGGGKHKKHGDAANQAADGNGGADQPQPEKPKHQKAVAEGTTGADGTVALSDVPAGEYVVLARLKGSGAGHEKLTVADKPETVTVTLKPRQAPANAGGAAK